jgi:hypothetical protein
MGVSSYRIIGGDIVISVISGSDDIVVINVIVIEC